MAEQGRVLVDIQAELAALRAENERLRAAQTKPIRLKVGEKGGLSVYGLGRFPLTLYKSQWTRLLGEVEAIKAFMELHKDKLTEKGE